MNYDMMDWDAEATRVARAFGMSEACYFEERLYDQPIESGGGNLFNLCFDAGRDGYLMPDHEGVVFWSTYDKRFGPCYLLERVESRGVTTVSIGADGKLWFEIDDPTLSPILAKGLFHLGLLTSEVEAEMNISITAHQKLEWTLKYEAQYKSDNPL